MESWISPLRDHPVVMKYAKGSKQDHKSTGCHRGCLALMISCQEGKQTKAVDLRGKLQEELKAVRGIEKGEELSAPDPIWFAKALRRGWGLTYEVRQIRTLGDVPPGDAVGLWIWAKKGDSDTKLTELKHKVHGHWVLIVAGDTEGRSYFDPSEGDILSEDGWLRRLASWKRAGWGNYVPYAVLIPTRASAGDEEAAPPPPSSGERATQEQGSSGTLGKVGAAVGLAAFGFAVGGPVGGAVGAVAGWIGGGWLRGGNKDS